MYSQEDDVEYQYPSDYEPSNHDYLSIDEAVPPPDFLALDWTVRDLPLEYRSIHMMEAYGSSYMAIDQVLGEINAARNQFEPFIHQNGTVIIHDPGLKVGICTSLVARESKFHFIVSFLPM